MLDSLPAMNKVVKIGKTEFTRKQVRGAYNPELDAALTEKILEFGKDCKRAHSSGVMRFTFQDSKMAQLEIAAILYFDCMPEDHPLKKQHTPQDITDYLAAARLWHYACDQVPYL